MTERLERHQVPVLLAAVLAGALLGVLAPGAGPTLEVLVLPVLGLLLWVTFLQVPLAELRGALGDRRFLGAVLGLNLVVAPVVAVLLGRVAPGGPAVELAVLLVLLAPCIDYVVVFARLAGGDDRRLLAATPLLLVAQTALLPLVLWLVLGDGVRDVVRPGPFVEALLVVVVLPLVLALATQAWGRRSGVGTRVRRVADRGPVVLMAATLLVVVGSQTPRVRDDLSDVALVAPLFVVFLVAMTVLGRALALRLRLGAPRGRALVLSGATRNSLVVLPLALAVDDPLVAAVVVTQTLVELVGLVVLVRLAPWLLPAGPSGPLPPRAPAIGSAPHPDGSGGDV